MALGAVISADIEEYSSFRSFGCRSVRSHSLNQPLQLAIAGKRVEGDIYQRQTLASNLFIEIWRRLRYPGNVVVSEVDFSEPEIRVVVGRKQCYLIKLVKTGNIKCLQNFPFIYCLSRYSRYLFVCLFQRIHKEVTHFGVER